MHSDYNGCASVGMRMYELSSVDGTDCLRSSSHDIYDFGLPFLSSPNSDFFTDFVNYDHMADSDLLTPCTGYDTDGQSDINIMDPVPPNDILPIITCTSTCCSSPDPYLTSFNQNELIPTLRPGISEDSDMPNIDESESFVHPLLDDKIVTDIVKGSTSSLEAIIDEDPSVLEYLLSENNSAHLTNRKPYHPDYDHCYSKQSEDKDSGWLPYEDPDDADSSDSSSEEVDVVTVSEEYQTPVVPKIQLFSFRNNRERRVQKSSRSKKNQNSLSAKTLNAAMKIKMRITGIHRRSRRKINNSVETTPSNSLPSSAPSSRCSSDVEDAGKRANHNSSERKRREVLRTNLQNLRLCVPMIENNPKAAKVNILNSAREYVRVLQKQDIESCSIIQKEKNKNKLLRLKVKKILQAIKSS